MNLRRGSGQPRVALIFDQHDGARIGDQKIRAADADIRRQEFLAQHGAGDHGLFFDDGLARHAQPLGKQIGDLLLRLMQRRRHDVVRPLVRQLNDVFAQIGLDRFQMVVLQPLVQVHLFGGHGFRLDDQMGAAFFGELKHEVRHVLAVFAEHDFSAMRFDVAREFFQVIIEMVDRVPLHCVGVRAQILVIRAAFRRNGFAALLDQSAGGRIDGQLQLAIGERRLNFFVKYG